MRHTTAPSTPRIARLSAPRGAIIDAATSRRRQAARHADSSGG